jgi:hypothetical protein
MGFLEAVTGRDLPDFLEKWDKVITDLNEPFKLF